MPRIGAIDFETRGTGTPLIVLHGGRLDRHHMIDTLEPVFATREGYRCIYPDMPGHGASDKDGVASYQDALDRLLAFVAAVAPDGPLLLAGESRGGYFARALAHALAHRLAGLLLIVPAREPNPPETDRAPPETRIAAPELRTGLEEALLPRFDALAVQNAEIVDKIRRMKLPALKRTDQAWQDQIEVDHLFDIDPDAAGRRVTAPTLILLGRQDAMVGWRAMLDRSGAYPHGTLALLDCAGHALAWERPHLFHALVEDWLDRVEQAP